MSPACFCPACAAPVIVATGPVVMPHVGTLTTFAYCTACALVTQVGASGLLIDLGGLLLRDLEEPFEPWCERAPFLIQQPSALLGRRDS